MHSPLPPQKTQGRACDALSPKQVQVINTRRKIWTRSRLPFSSPPPHRAEQVGSYRRRGRTRAPERAHTTAKVAPIVKGKGKPIWGVCCMGHPLSPQLCLKHLPGMMLHLPLSSLIWGHLNQPPPQGQQERADPGHRPRKGRMAGSESWQGGNIGMEETACTFQKAWGMKAPILHLPLNGLELLFAFCQRW